MNNYELIEKKYLENNILDFKFKTADEVKKILEFDFRTCRGFKNLSEEHKQKAEILICNYLNRWGLETRLEKRPTSIKYCVENKIEYFKLNIKNGGYVKLLFTGEVA